MMKKKLNIKRFVFNPFQVNTYILSDSSGRCIIIDPGCSNPSEELEILSFLEENDLQPLHVLLTHGHLDHVCGTGLFYKHFDLQPALHPADFFLYETIASQSEVFSFPVPEMPPVKALDEGPVRAGDITLEIIPLPGHSPGGVAFYATRQKSLFSGDILFRGSIGRSDLPGGDYNRLMESIQIDILERLDEKVKIFPGHGPETTIGHEARTNPFLDFSIQ